MKNVVIGAIISCAIVLTSGCASILNDDFQRVNIATSTGQKITVTIEGKEFQAPGIITVTRENADKIVMTSAKGCTEQTLMAKEVDNMFWLNILSGGSFGSSTDYGTEQMWGYQERVVVTCAN
jgi:hypothetical protein